MKTYSISNPYPPGSAEHRVSGRVSSSDYAYLKRLLPAANGIIDATISTFFSRFITALRNQEIQNGQPFEPAFEPLHPTVLIYESVVERCSFGESGGDATSSQHVERGTSSIHPTEQSPTPVSTDAQSRSDEAFERAQNEKARLDERKKRRGLGEGVA